MTRLVIAIAALALLAGCNDEITADNSPDEHERIDAMEMCLGVHRFEIKNRPFEQRLACVQAVYGLKP